LVLGALAYAVLRLSEPVKSAVPSPPPTAAPEHRQVTFTGKEGAPTISADGRRIAYVSYEAPEPRVIVQELAGGQPLAIFSAPEVGHLRWSPNGSDLLIWARGAGKNGIYSVPQLGGNSVRIAAGQYIGCWSPDGSTIAVPSYLGGKIWFFNRRGQQQQAVSLQGIPWSIWDIDWSPQTGLLTFVSSDPQGRFTIWTVRPDGSDQTRILSDDVEILSTRWAPQGDAIYYVRRVNQTVSLYKIPARPDPGSSQLDATTMLTGIESDRSFALSVDGKRLVYARAPYHSNLWMLDAPGNGRHTRTEWKQLTNGTSLIERPRLSPDGKTIVFSMGHEPTANLHTMPIAGGSPKQLTFLDSFNVGGVWSADGRQIAFASTEGGKPRVWTIDAAGGTPRPLSSGDMSSTLDLVWSPGSRVLYQRAGNRDYYALDPATGKEQLIARDSSVGWLFRPLYSPDGQKIAAFWNRPPNRGVWIIHTDEQSERLVYKSSIPSMIIPIGWSEDGCSIYAVEGKGSGLRGREETLKDARILMVPVNGDDVSTVAALPFGEIGDVSMTPDGRRFIVSVYSSRSDVWIVDNFDASTERRITNR
jgi:Tol biopolymer transport system component